MSSILEHLDISPLVLLGEVALGDTHMKTKKTTSASVLLLSDKDFGIGFGGLTHESERKLTLDGPHAGSQAHWRGSQRGRTTNGPGTDCHPEASVREQPVQPQSRL